MRSWLVLFAISTLATATPEVQLGQTTITGSNSGDIETFKGIPFASPPLGSLRFQPPILQTSLNVTTLNASNYGPACLQHNPIPPVSGISEDCLTLDIYRPSEISGLLPVLVWIYGGGFNAGSTSQYDFSFFVNKSVERGTPIIVVAVNYRLRHFGFPQGDEAASRNALNLGLKDQLVGLEWIQANIDVFGGDKTMVTVCGQSAGAFSVDVHLHGPQLKNLARAAITQSTYDEPIYSVALGNDDWAGFVKAIPQCADTAGTEDTFTCLQQVDTETLFNASAAYTGGLGSFLPVIDGPGGLIPDFPSQNAMESPLPLLIGSNLDEGTLLILQDVNSTDVIRALFTSLSTPSPRGAEALEQAMDRLFELYPNDPALGSPYGTGNETFGFAPEYKQFASIMGDLFFQSRTRMFALDSSKKYSNPTYTYHFTDPNAVVPDFFFPGQSLAAAGTPHAVETLYTGFWGPLSSWNVTDPDSLTLSDQMQDYWLSFITSLDPNDGIGSERPEWTEYTSSGAPELLQLSGGNLTLTAPTFRREQIDFLNQDPVLFRK